MGSCCLSNQSNVHNLFRRHVLRKRQTNSWTLFSNITYCHGSKMHLHEKAYTSVGLLEATFARWTECSQLLLVVTIYKKRSLLQIVAVTCAASFVLKMWMHIIKSCSPKRTFKNFFTISKLRTMQNRMLLLFPKSGRISSPVKAKNFLWFMHRRFGSWKIPWSSLHSC